MNFSYDLLVSAVSYFEIFKLWNLHPPVLPEVELCFVEIPHRGPGQVLGRLHEDDQLLDAVRVLEMSKLNPVIRTKILTVRSK